MLAVIFHSNRSRIMLGFVINLHRDCFSAAFDWRTLLSQHQAWFVCVHALYILVMFLNAICTRVLLRAQIDPAFSLTLFVVFTSALRIFAITSNVRSGTQPLTPIAMTDKFASSLSLGVCICDGI